MLFSVEWQRCLGSVSARFIKALPLVDPLSCLAGGSKGKRGSLKEAEAELGVEQTEMAFKLYDNTPPSYYVIKNKR